MRIEPTVGRVVWYKPDQGGPHTRESEQPLKADVVHVNKDGTVNLFVVDHIGNHHREHAVVLVQEGDPLPAGHFCTWMPYQVGQAKKHAEEVRDAGGVDALGPGARTVDPYREVGKPHLRGDQSSADPNAEVATAHRR